jgi:hypothetical protein
MRSAALNGTEQLTPLLGERVHQRQPIVSDDQLRALHTCGHVKDRFSSRRSSSSVGSERDGVPSSCCVPTTLTFNISCLTFFLVFVFYHVFIFVLRCAMFFPFHITRDALQLQVLGPFSRSRRSPNSLCSRREGAHSIPCINCWQTGTS